MPLQAMRTFEAHEILQNCKVSGSKIAVFRRGSSRVARARRDPDSDDHRHSDVVAAEAVGSEPPSDRRRRMSPKNLNGFNLPIRMLQRTRRLARGRPNGSPRNQQRDFAKAAWINQAPINQGKDNARAPRCAPLPACISTAFPYNRRGLTVVLQDKWPNIGTTAYPSPTNHALA
jgi:hypothetical protein